MPYHTEFSLFDPGGQRKYLNRVERRKFFAVVNTMTRNDIRLFCLLLFYTGGRISEIFELTSANIDFTNKALTIRTLKRRCEGLFRQVPLSDEFLSDLKAYTVTIEEGESLWRFSLRSAARYIKTAMQNAGITGPRSSALGLRHGFAVHAVGTVPITKVQKWMGHAHLETTALYLNVCGAEEREMAKRLWEV